MNPSIFLTLRNHRDRFILPKSHTHQGTSLRTRLRARIQQDGLFWGSSPNFKQFTRSQQLCEYPVNVKPSRCKWSVKDSQEAVILRTTPCNLFLQVLTTYCWSENSLIFWNVNVAKKSSVSVMLTTESKRQTWLRKRTEHFTKHQ